MKWYANGGSQLGALYAEINAAGTCAWPGGAERPPRRPLTIQEKQGKVVAPTAVQAFRDGASVADLLPGELR